MTKEEILRTFDFMVKVDSPPECLNAFIKAYRNFLDAACDISFQEGINQAVKIQTEVQNILNTEHITNPEHDLGGEAPDMSHD